MLVVQSSLMIGIHPSIFRFDSEGEQEQDQPAKQNIPTANVNKRIIPYPYPYQLRCFFLTRQVWDGKGGKGRKGGEGGTGLEFIGFITRSGYYNADKVKNKGRGTGV